MDHSLALVPSVTATKTILLQDAVLAARRRGEHSEGADHLPACEEGRCAAHARSAATASLAQLDNVAQVESLVAVVALGLLNWLPPRQTSGLASLQARKVVCVATASSVDELLALPVVVVIPLMGLSNILERTNVLICVMPHVLICVFYHALCVIPWLQSPARSTVHRETAGVRFLLPS